MTVGQMRKRIDNAEHVKNSVFRERAERKHTLVLKPAASQDELDAHKGNQQSTISCETSAPHSCVFTTFVLEKQNVGSETKSK